MPFSTDDLLNQADVGRLLLFGKLGVDELAARHGTNRLG
jgi:hypothetical protein